MSHRIYLPFGHGLRGAAHPLSVALPLVSLVSLVSLSARAQTIDFATFDVVDWHAKLQEPDTFVDLQYAANGNDITVPSAGNNYGAVISPQDAISGPDDSFEMSLVFNDPNADDDWWGMTFGLRPGDDINDAPTQPQSPWDGDAALVYNDADWVAWSWKATAQSFPTSGPLSTDVSFTPARQTAVGMELADISGIIACQEWISRADHPATAGVYRPLAAARPGSPGAESYQGATKTCVRTRYSTTEVTIWVNGVRTIDYRVADDAQRVALPAGPWGLIFVAENGITLRAGLSLCPGDQDRDGVDDIDDDDDDNDGILDAVEVSAALLGDANANGVADYADVDAAGFTDANGDGIDDRADADGDSIPNHFDSDSDGDGIDDLVEGNDANGDRVNDNTAVSDVDGDGVIDSLGPDVNGNGVEDSYDAVPAITQDSDSPSDEVPDYLDPNAPPVFVSSATFNVAEGELSVAILSADDAEGNPLTYALEGGVDAGRFSLSSTGALSFTSVKSFAAPDDADGDGTYDIDVSVCETTLPSACARQRITVVLMDVNEPPTITSPNSFTVAEGQTQVAQLTSSDTERSERSFALDGGADASQFSLSAGGQLAFVAAKDFEEPDDADLDGVYQVEVEVCESVATSNCARQSLSIALTDVNEPPRITSSGGAETASIALADIRELMENGLMVARVTATDPEFDALVFSIVDGLDAIAFVIDPVSGSLRFVAQPSLGALELEVQVCDDAPAPLCDRQRLHVVVGSSNLAPQITSSGGQTVANVSVDENQRRVTRVEATDPNAGDVVTFTLSPLSADQALFVLDEATGELAFLVAPDAEAPSDGDSDGIYEVQILACDDGLPVLCTSQTLRVTVRSVNEAPEITSDGGQRSAALVVGEGQVAVTTLKASDPDPGAEVHFELLPGADPKLFSLDDESGELSFKQPPDFEQPDDADQNNVYQVPVRACDQDGACVEQALEIRVEDRNDVPVFLSNGGASAVSVIVEPAAVLISSLAALDQDGDELTFRVAGGPDAQLFDITPDDELVFLAAPRAGLAADADQDGVYEVTIEVCDPAGACSRQSFSVALGDLDTDSDGVLDGDDDDADNDGVLNRDEGTQDIDGDGVPNWLDLDSDGDGIPDVVEAGGAAYDANGDGRVDSHDDADGNGVSSVVDGVEVEGAELMLSDADGDGLYDFQDSDSDDDGVPDRVEGHDNNHDGRPDVEPLGEDLNGDGLDDAFDPTRGGAALTLPNTDHAGAPDYLDPDDDGDGILTRDEDANGRNGPTDDDTDGDGVPDYLDAEATRDPTPPTQTVFRLRGGGAGCAVAVAASPGPTLPAVLIVFALGLGRRRRFGLALVACLRSVRARALQVRRPGRKRELDGV